MNDAVPAEVRLYDRLFVEAHPEAGGKDFLKKLDTNSLKVMLAIVEPQVATANAQDKFSLRDMVFCGQSGGAYGGEA